VEIVIALFDGEDFGDFIHGSTYFADHMGNLRPDQALIIDMIGDADLHVQRETNSLTAAPQLFNSVLTAANELGYSKHFDGSSYSIIDDHIPPSGRASPPSTSSTSNTDPVTATGTRSPTRRTSAAPSPCR